MNLYTSTIDHHINIYIYHIYIYMIMGMGRLSIVFLLIIASYLNLRTIILPFPSSATPRFQVQGSGCRRTWWPGRWKRRLRPGRWEWEDGGEDGCGKKSQRKHKAIPRFFMVFGMFLGRVFCKFSKCVKSARISVVFWEKLAFHRQLDIIWDGKNVEIPDLKFCQRFSFHQQCHLHPQMKMWPASFSPSFSPTLSI